MRFHKKKRNGVLTEELTVCNVTVGTCPNGDDNVHIEAETEEDAYRVQAENEGMSTLTTSRRSGSANSKTAGIEKAYEAEMAEQESAEYMQDYERDKNVDITLSTLQPREFDINAEGDVVIPEDVRANLMREIDNGYITASQSEDGSLVMLKYSKFAMYEQRWNETTVNFRGVLTDSEYKRVYARGFTKFFNVSEHEQRPAFPELPTQDPVILSKKMDGSLGLIARVDNENRVFTSGSARRESNEIASEGEKILHEKMSEAGEKSWQAPKNVTILTEIISEKNPIVVDYTGQRRLVALAAVDNKTGKTLTDEELQKVWPGEHVEKIHDGQPMSYEQSLSVDIPDGEEGFVLEFQGRHRGIRAKVKGQEYLQAHKVLTNMSVKNLWESIRDRNDESLLATVKKTAPESAYSILEKAHSKLLSDLDERVDKREKAVKQAIAQYNRKHNKSSDFILTADDVSKDDMPTFVDEIRRAGESKADFAVDIMLARGRREQAVQAALKQMRPHGQTSIVSLVSAEKTEVGDDADDNVGRIQ